MGNTPSQSSSDPVYPPYLIPVTLSNPSLSASSSPRPAPNTTSESSPHTDNPQGSSSTSTPSPPVAHFIDFASSPLSASYPNHFALVIDNCFTPTECDELIALAEGGGDWIAAEINGRVDPGYRNSLRILRDDKDAADRIMERLRPWLEEVGVIALIGKDDKRKLGGESGWEQVEQDGKQEKEGGKKYKWEQVVYHTPKYIKGVRVPDAGSTKWDLVGLNERLRFLKYTKGQLFERKFPDLFSSDSY